MKILNLNAPMVNVCLIMCCAMGKMTVAISLMKISAVSYCSPVSILNAICNFIVKYFIKQCILHAMRKLTTFLPHVRDYHKSMQVF